MAPYHKDKNIKLTIDNNNIGLLKKLIGNSSDSKWINKFLDIKDESNIINKASGLYEINNISKISTNSDNKKSEENKDNKTDKNTKSNTSSNKNKDKTNSNSNNNNNSNNNGKNKNDNKTTKNDTSKNVKDSSNENNKNNKNNSKSSNNGKKDNKNSNTKEKNNRNDKDKDDKSNEEVTPIIINEDSSKETSGNPVNNINSYTNTNPSKFNSNIDSSANNSNINIYPTEEINGNNPIYTSENPLPSANGINTINNNNAKNINNRNSISIPIFGITGIFLVALLVSGIFVVRLVRKKKTEEKQMKENEMKKQQARNYENPYPNQDYYALPVVKDEFKDPAESCEEYLNTLGRLKYKDPVYTSEVSQPGSQHYPSPVISYSFSCAANDINNLPPVNKVSSQPIMIDPQFENSTPTSSGLNSEPVMTEPPHFEDYNQTTAPFTPSQPSVLPVNTFMPSQSILAPQPSIINAHFEQSNNIFDQKNFNKPELNNIDNTNLHTYSYNDADDSTPLIDSFCIVDSTNDILSPNDIASPIKTTSPNNEIPINVSSPNLYFKNKYNKKITFN